MNRILHMRINLYESLIQIWIFPDKDLRIKRHRNKERRHSTLNRDQENITDLQADEECECHDDRSEAAAGVVSGVRELNVQVGKEGAHVGDENGAHC